MLSSLRFIFYEFCHLLFVETFITLGRHNMYQIVTKLFSFQVSDWPQQLQRVFVPVTKQCCLHRMGKYPVGWLHLYHFCIMYQCSVVQHFDICQH